MAKLFEDSEAADDKTHDPDLSELTPDEALETLVGEGKKYRTVADLARSSVFAQDHIKRLETEKRELERNLQEKMTMEAFLTKLNAAPKETPPVIAPPQEAAGKLGETAERQTATDFTQLVTRLIQEDRAKSQEAANLERVQKTLRENWGPSFSVLLKAKAAEMNVTEQDLTALAGSRPDFFLKALGGTEKIGTANPRGVQAPLPSSKTSGLGSAPGGVHQNKAYFDNLRRTKPNEFFTGKVQEQMLAAALALGDDFAKKQ